MAQTLKEGGSRPGLREGLGSRMERDWVGLRTCTKQQRGAGRAGQARVVVRGTLPASPASSEGIRNDGSR